MPTSLEEQWAVLTRNNPGSLVELVEIPGAGRGLRCRREVGAGEVVLEDWPVVIGRLVLRTFGEKITFVPRSIREECQG